MRSLLLASCLAFVAACERRGGCDGPYCGTLVLAATGQPDILLPPVTDIAVSRDIFSQVFLKLADLGTSTNTVGDEDFQPLLAQRWEWDDSVTLVFHIDPRARWQDGPPVTAADVAFTFDAYTDPRVNSSARAVLQDIRAVTARDSLTAVFRFRRRHPEMFYDAVYHMRILPTHLLRTTPRDQWLTAAFGRAPVGNGPYRFVEWTPGERVELAADSTFFLGRPHIRRLIWRFTPDLQVAVSQLLAGEADAVEILGPPDNVRRAREAPHLTVYPYRGISYGYLALNLWTNGDTTRPHPIFGDRSVRRALTMAVDRARLLRSVWGDLAKVPPGPVPQFWWIWDLQARGLPYDTAQAARLLRFAGWRDTDGDGIRDRDSVKLSFRLLVPTTSAVRRQYARLLQEQYRLVGVDVQIEEVESTVFGQRGRAGQFDAALASWNTDPTPSSSLRQTWTRQGFGGTNYSRYHNPAFDELIGRATTGAISRDRARAFWRAAIELLNNDAPGIWLYAPDHVAGVHNRVADVTIRPDEYWALVRTWRIPPERQIDRDRVEH